jgi:hypothetical protein
VQCIAADIRESVVCRTPTDVYLSDLISINRSVTVIDFNYFYEPAQGFVCIFPYADNVNMLS